MMIPLFERKRKNFCKTKIRSEVRLANFKNQTFQMPTTKHTPVSLRNMFTISEMDARQVNRYEVFKKICGEVCQTNWKQNSEQISFCISAPASRQGWVVWEPSCNSICEFYPPRKRALFLSHPKGNKTSNGCRARVACCFMGGLTPPFFSQRDSWFVPSASQEKKKSSEFFWSADVNSFFSDSLRVQVSISWRRRIQGLCIWICIYRYSYG